MNDAFDPASPNFNPMGFWLDSVWNPLPAPSSVNGMALYENVNYSITPGFRPVQLDIYKTPSTTNQPCVIWIHGGGYEVLDKKFVPPLFDRLETFGKIVAAGFTLVSIDYRMTGEVLWPAPLHDVWDAIAWVQNRSGDLGVDPTQVNLWGESAGAHLAMHGGLRFNPETYPKRANLKNLNHVNAIVEWYGPVDFTQMDDFDGVQAVQVANSAESPMGRLLGGAPRELPAAANDVNVTRFVSANSPALQVRHGVVDALVSIKQARLLKATIDECDTVLDYREIAGADHGFIGMDNPETLVDEGIAFLQANT